ncbi:TPA: aminopeptidase P family N-terminal domain-containing protein [Clostridium botulinum]|nr:aminopeptidase P family N-terminal domain-containing protein [Clostridium botulinum]
MEADIANIIIHVANKTNQNATVVRNLSESSNTPLTFVAKDDIAWTLNIRGNHIEFFPLILLLQWIRCIYSSIKIN